MKERMSLIICSAAFFALGFITTYCAFTVGLGWGFPLSPANNKFAIVLSCICGFVLSAIVLPFRLSKNHRVRIAGVTIGMVLDLLLFFGISNAIEYLADF